MEFWFAPKVVSLEASTAGDRKSFVFREASMQVYARILDADGQAAVPCTYEGRQKAGPL